MNTPISLSFLYIKRDRRQPFGCRRSCFSRRFIPFRRRANASVSLDIQE